jgi:hypothetical protein
MKYKITQAYCWFDSGTKIVKMYFMNSIPFTFDELPHYALNDLELIEQADQQLRYAPEDLYKSSEYLIMEECHPCLFPVELENPEDLPCD